MYACASGHEEVVRVLLKAGADVSLHNENGHTPLMEAASAGHVGIAKLLVEHGAQVNAHSAEFKVGLVRIYEESFFVFIVKLGGFFVPRNLL